MASMSNYLENRLLDHALAVAPYVSPPMLYVALFDTTSSLANLEMGVLAGEVVPGLNAYARQSVGFSAASGGAASNVSQLLWTNVPTVTVAFIAVVDALTGGNVLLYGGLETPKVLGAGDSFVVGVGDLDVVFG